MTQQAPDFSLKDQDGVVRHLADYHGKWLVVYFYPNNRALNCTREACKFRDEYRIIKQFSKAEIIGINKGSVTSHKRFSVRHKLNFPILSDPKHKVTLAYGAWKSKQVKWYDRPYGTRRNTYLVNPAGKIVKEYLNVDPVAHVTEVISDLQKLQAS